MSRRAPSNEIACIKRKLIEQKRWFCMNWFPSEPHWRAQASLKNGFSVFGSGDTELQAWSDLMNKIAELTR